MANVEVENSAESRRLLTNRKKGRSRMGNGSELLPMTDGRSVTARRFKDLYGDICSDLGGLDRLSDGEKQLARRVAQLSAESERMEALSARGEQALDLKAYVAVSDCIGRLLQKLGFTRHLREVDHHPQSLRGYLAAVEHEEAAK